MMYSTDASIYHMEPICIIFPKNEEIVKHIIKIASKYPVATQNYFSDKGKQIECVKLNGSIEIAPLLGISEMIVDLVSTGKTLEENNLEVVEKISDVSSNLIVNRISLKTKSDEINKIINAFEKKLL